MNRCDLCKKRVWKWQNWGRKQGVCFHANCITSLVLKHDPEVFFHDNDLNPPKDHVSGVDYKIRCIECAGMINMLNIWMARRGRERVYFHESCAGMRAYGSCEKSLNMAGLTKHEDEEIKHAVSERPDKTVPYKGLMPKGF